MPPQTASLPVHGASVTTFDRFGDSRGYFNELYNEEKYTDVTPAERWKQVSFSSSGKHALRGLHCSPHGKFITCVRGSFYDVIADFREESPTFGRWCGVVLTEANKKQVFVPARCGHGFFTFEDNTCALYLQEGCFNPANEADTRARHLPARRPRAAAARAPPPPPHRALPRHAAPPTPNPAPTSPAPCRRALGQTPSTLSSKSRGPSRPA